MTIEQMQAAVDEIRNVCQKYGVVLLGTCRAEGIYGEITIEPTTGESGWEGRREALTNRVEPQCEDGCCFAVNGIGDLVEETPHG